MAKRKRRKTFAKIAWSDWSEPQPLRHFEDTSTTSDSFSPCGLFRIIRTVTIKTNEDDESVTVTDYFPLYWKRSSDHYTGKGGYWANCHWDYKEWVYRSLAKARLLAEARADGGKAGIKELFAARDKRRIKARFARQARR
ncbi:uncharacterized protein METZ01_LOCUS446284 [marine metagenome]|uniref:Uncharacterized protein n=1 Tax=marine metagenome TaxID=408172 RepID=A0A382ZDR5_9ZZZZ|tara:strand:+ start:3479 stop:3898 length:420 start_codon:yes stop_codon:yes gene_type:complete